MEIVNKTVHRTDCSRIVHCWTLQCALFCRI